MREKLPARRPAVTRTIEHRGQSYDVTFGLASTCEGWRVREAFLSNHKGGDAHAMVNDACIAISMLLQHGVGAAELAHAFGEDRAEGEKSGPPSSPLGAVARMAVKLDEAEAEAFARTVAA